MLSQLGQPSAVKIAAHLGCSVRTVQRWIAADHAPRVAALALYWSTNHGLHTAQVTAENEAALYYGIAESYRVECERLRRELARVLSVGDFGCANAPSFTAPTAAELFPRQRLPPLRQPRR